MFSYIAAGSIGLILVFLALMPDPSPRCGVYVQPNKWYPLKYALFRFLLWLRRRRNSAMQQTTGEGAGYGVRSRSTPEDMDKVQELPKDQPLVSRGAAVKDMSGCTRTHTCTLASTCLHACTHKHDTPLARHHAIFLVTVLPVYDLFE